MVTFFKDLVLNFGQSYPAFSTVFVAAVFGSLWWFLIVKGPKASAQSQPPQTPSVQQSTGNVSGGSTVNQAGRDVIINQGVSEDTIRQLINQKAVSAQVQLTARYPKGYVILGIANGKIIYRTDNAPKSLQIDWESADVKINKEKNEVWIRMPDLSMTGLRMRNINVAIPYQNGAVRGLAQINDNDLNAEVLDADSGILVVGMK